MRRVLYKSFDHTKHPTEIDVREGVFHQWADSIYEEEMPKAIVETTDGKVVLVKSIDIQFIEGWKK